MSHWFALLYKLKPGTEDDVRDLFANSGRPDHEVKDDAGAIVGKLLTTLVFVGEETAVRVIEVDGDLRQVSRHMGRQPVVAAFEQEIEQYLAEPRDMRSPEGAQEFFRKRGLHIALERHLG